MAHFFSITVFCILIGMSQLVNELLFSCYYHYYCLLFFIFLLFIFKYVWYLALNNFAETSNGMGRLIMFNRRSLASCSKTTLYNTTISIFILPFKTNLTRLAYLFCFKLLRNNWQKTHWIKIYQFINLK